MNSLNQYIDLYRQHGASIDAHSPELLNSRRPEALRHLVDASLPARGSESYMALSPNEMFAPDYGLNINRVEFPVDTASTFRCGVPNVSTLMALVVNDTFRPTSTLVRNLPQGVVLTSLADAAARNLPGIDRLGTIADGSNPAVALNDLLLQDGVYIHIAKDTVVDRPLQIVNIFNSATPILGNRRLLVVADDGSKATILTCDHSQMADVDYLANQVIEVQLGVNASLSLYDLEESSARTSRLSQLYARQGEGSSLRVNGSTLIGGTTRNNYYISCDGDNTDTHLSGMIIGSDTQVTDNYTNLTHRGNGGVSNQLFKYILSDVSVGAFYGTITVDECARFTTSGQTNRNILASPEARMYTRPQLEIYCDEVKCSHGATIGQLDSRALFYMQQRGIPLDQARLMLMQAFMSDVIESVDIPALKTRLLQLTESRLCGEHMLCADCKL